MCDHCTLITTTSEPQTLRRMLENIGLWHLKLTQSGSSRVFGVETPPPKSTTVRNGTGMGKSMQKEIAVYRPPFSQGVHIIWPREMLIQTYLLQIRHRVELHSGGSNL